MCWIHHTALICAINYATEDLQQKISSPNMVCTDNHAKEDIQQYCCWHCHVKMERAREREERLRRLNEHFKDLQLIHHPFIVTYLRLLHICTLLFSNYSTCMQQFVIILIAYQSKHFGRSTANCSGSPINV